MFLVLIATLLWVPTISLAETLKICYVSSNIGNILPRATDYNLQYAGFNVAIDNYNLTHSDYKILFQEFKNEKKFTDSIFMAEAINWAKQENCLAIVGLVSSRDAMIAGEFLKKHQIVGISSTATLDTIDQWYPYVLSVQMSAQDDCTAIFKFIKRRYNKKNVFIVSSPGNIFSISYTEILKNLLPQAKVLTLTDKFLIDPSEANRLANNDTGAVLIYTTYPIDSFPSVNQLSPQIKGNIVIIGNTTWMEKQLFVQQISSFQKFSKTFVFSGWDINKLNTKFLDFKVKYKKQFGVIPGHDSTYDYDVANLIISCINLKHITVAQLSSCLVNMKKYNGATGTIFMNRNKSHYLRKNFYLVELKDIINF